MGDFCLSSIDDMLSETDTSEFYDISDTNSSPGIFGLSAIDSVAVVTGRRCGGYMTKPATQDGVMGCVSRKGPQVVGPRSRCTARTSVKSRCCAVVSSNTVVSIE